ncbi:MAG: hypothetical protein H6702_23565 [Myxococcales bacterium]|nr:hypothetical protein [Myxococcales bacterium]
MCNTNEVRGPAGAGGRGGAGAGGGVLLAAPQVVLTGTVSTVGGEDPEGGGTVTVLHCGPPRGADLIEAGRVRVGSLQGCP